MIDATDKTRVYQVKVTRYPVARMSWSIQIAPPRPLLDSAIHFASISSSCYNNLSVQI